MEKETPILKFQNITKKYGGFTALNNVSFEVTKGKVIGLVGPNGAGKTTLFNVISGFIRPDSGSHFYKSKRITGLSPHKIASLGISRTFQDVKILGNLTVLENVLVFIQNYPREHPLSSLFSSKKKGDEDKYYERVLEVLSIVGLEDKAHLTADKLSYAEQKRVLIARLMASTGELLLLDEIASGLDQQQINTILEYIHELRRLGKTLLVIEHNLDLIKDVSDEIFFLDQGTLIAQGEPEELLRKPELEEIYFGKGGGAIQYA